MVKYLRISNIIHTFANEIKQQMISKQIIGYSGTNRYVTYSIPKYKGLQPNSKHISKGFRVIPKHTKRVRNEKAYFVCM